MLVSKLLHSFFFRNHDLFSDFILGGNHFSNFPLLILVFPTGKLNFQSYFITPLVAIF